jgi:hypothetical protein
VAKKSTEKSIRKRDDRAGLFIPAGLILGLGFGFLFKSIPAFLFLGLGAGFLLFALAKNRD